MAALMWTLAWLTQVLPALSGVSGPVNLTISSARFNHTLRWEPGPGTPSGVYYRVFFQAQRGTAWLPVAGCQHVQHPLVCDLTQAFSDPLEGYITQVTALLEEHIIGFSHHETFEPIRDTIPDNPRLTVTPCGKDLCVDLQPPVENLRKIYEDLKYKLKIQSANKAYEQDFVSLEEKVLGDLVPGREYCVSVCFSDKELCGKSKYSRPVCASTRANINSDALISTLLCVVVLAAMAVVGLLVYTGFLCLRGGPLPSILTSVPHINVNLLIHSPSQTSILNVRATPPSSGRKSPDSSDDESVTNPPSVRSYKLWVGANLSSSNQNSNPSNPNPNPAAGSESDCPADALTGGGSQIKEEEAVVEVDSQNINLLTLTSGTHREGEEEVEEQEQEKEKEKEESAFALRDVNLFTLKFGTHRSEEVEQEEKSEDESPSAPNLPEQTARREGAESQTVSCSEDEDEDEEELTYIVRFCAHYRR